MGTHQVKLTFRPDCLTAELICPEDGCLPDTEGAEVDCWLEGWDDNEDLCEYMEGEVLVPVEAEWDNEHGCPLVKIVSPAMSRVSPELAKCVFEQLRDREVIESLHNWDDSGAALHGGVIAALDVALGSDYPAPGRDAEAHVMSARKTPILLRKAPVSGGVMALTRYTRKTVRGREVLDSGTNGKQDVTADFDALVLDAPTQRGLAQELLDPDAGGITAALDGAAKGLDLNAAERKELRAFRKRLVAIIERHNKKGHGVA